MRAYRSSLPCPPWLSAELDRQVRVQRLILELACLKDRDFARTAPWVARGASLTSHGTVEQYLQFFRALILSGQL
jgi:hypothetical protein